MTTISISFITSNAISDNAPGVFVSLIYFLNLQCMVSS